MIDDSIKKSIREWALSWPSVTRVFIFGSRARGDHGADSDLDIAVEVAPGPGDGSPDATWAFDSAPYVARLKSVLAYLGYDIDVHSVNFDANEERVAPGVLTDGELIFKRRGS